MAKGAASIPPEMRARLEGLANAAMAAGKKEQPK
jgi:hypothetical protein